MLKSMSLSASRQRSETGEGPGVIAPDGSAVDFYALLPVRGELTLIHEAAPERASVLDLGAGAGRLAHPLTAWGHEVVAVDESPEMLARIHNAQTVCSRIEDLRLGRAFDVVVLASQLINVPDENVRGQLLATCRRHVHDDGVVLIERVTREWADTAAAKNSDMDGISLQLHIIDRPGPGLVTASMGYGVGERHWTHTFTMRGLGDHEMRQELAHERLRFDRCLTEDGRWITARPTAA